MDKILVRAFVPEIRKKNTDTRTVTFVASDGSRDSAHTVLNQAGWDLKRFNSNPVIGYNHEVYGAWDTKDVDFVIGKGRAYVEDNTLLVDITFEPKEINELAEKVYQKILFGSLNAVSVGFLPIGKGAWGKGEEGPGEERGEDRAAEELEALRKEAEKQPEDPKDDGEDRAAAFAAVEQRAQIVMAASAANV